MCSNWCIFTPEVGMMRSYTTLYGRVIDLTDLNPEEADFFNRCLDAYRNNGEWADLGNLIASKENPLVRDAGGWITQAVWDHPLFRAVHDLTSRLGIEQGEIAPGPNADL